MGLLSDEAARQLRPHPALSASSSSSSSSIMGFLDIIIGPIKLFIYTLIFF